MGVVAAPRCSRALCLLGSAQLAQSDSDAAGERGQAALANACLSFQASIELEGSHQTGEPPEQLTSKYCRYFTQLGFHVSPGWFMLV